MTMDVHLICIYDNRYVIYLE